ncbi:hypothetical protein AGMMS49990_10480 [Endomicrobiia bacterium]|nr:hypothetical protein AGMMS49990_10480 [Endomicrobiia bacterium]
MIQRLKKQRKQQSKKKKRHTITVGSSQIKGEQIVCTAIIGQGTILVYLNRHGFVQRKTKDNKIHGEYNS